MVGISEMFSTVFFRIGRACRTMWGCILLTPTKVRPRILSLIIFDFETFVISKVYESKGLLIPITMDNAIFNKERHVKYFLRCLKTVLPNLYTSNDSNRILLAFFTIAGLDLLGALQSKTTAEERRGYIEWVYHCQVPSGGFRGFTGADFGLNKRTPENEIWDPANLPATFFALMILIILGDDLSRVKRKECLRWLRTMQRDDGSFGEVLGAAGAVEGGRDLRFCCVAAGIRYILRGKDGKDTEGLEDINVDRLVSFIEACQVRRFTGTCILYY